MSLNPTSYLQHILDEINYLEQASKDLNYDDFLKDSTLIRAFARSLEIIGEAAKKIPEDFKEKHNDIEWKSMAGMRDKLIHDYFGIDFELIWNVIKNHLPQLKVKIEKLI